MLETQTHISKRYLTHIRKTQSNSNAFLCKECLCRAGSCVKVTHADKHSVTCTYTDNNLKTQFHPQSHNKSY